jgi:hypothetical protein
VLGLWIEQSEGAKFWLKVINEFKARGVNDILIAVVDGLKGFVEAITSVDPRTIVQTCIVHLIRGVAGRLVGPFEMALPLNVSYFLVRSSDGPPRHEIRCFREWLFSSMRRRPEGRNSRWEKR